MPVKNPVKFWKNISEKKDWRDYILPRKKFRDFDKEGFLEAERLFYFYDKRSVVLDYGCGIGRVAKYISKKAKFVICLDICDSFLKKARRYINRKNVRYYLSNKYKKENVADFIYSLMVFQHNDFKNRQKIINHIYKLLKRNGTALIQFPKHSSVYYQESSFVHKFKLKEVKAYAKIFKSYYIIEANLPNYMRKIDKRLTNEYFLIAKKK